MLMHSADWEHWALVFRAGGREAAAQAPESGRDLAGFVLARALHKMADQCDEIARAAREVGR